MRHSADCPLRARTDIVCCVKPQTLLCLLAGGKDKVFSANLMESYSEQSDHNSIMIDGLRHGKNPFSPTLNMEIPKDLLAQAHS